MASSTMHYYTPCASLAIIRVHLKQATKCQYVLSVHGPHVRYILCISSADDIFWVCIGIHCILCMFFTDVLCMEISFVYALYHRHLLPVSAECVWDLRYISFFTGDFYRYVLSMCGLCHILCVCSSLEAFNSVCWVCVELHYILLCMSFTGDFVAWCTGCS